MSGAGFLDKLKDVGRFIKDQRLISKGLGLVDNKYGKVGSAITGAVGLGRKRRKKRQTGGSYNSHITTAPQGFNYSLNNTPLVGDGRKRKRKMRGSGPVSTIAHTIGNIGGLFGLGKSDRRKLIGM
jgi:hypothetical protein